MSKEILAIAIFYYGIPVTVLTTLAGMMLLLLFH